MRELDPVPPATADRVEHADWLELQALAARDGSSSMQDFASALRSSGSAEELYDEANLAQDVDAYEDESDEDALGAQLAERGGETIEPIAEAAFYEVEDRSASCDGGYGFTLGEDDLKLRSRGRGDVYVFLLLLSTFGKDRLSRLAKNAATETQPNLPQLFEEISAVALQNCLGGARNDVRTYPFGFPRRIGPRGFRQAVDELCRCTGEGAESRDRPKRRDQKDAALDLVVWRPFPDGRRAIMMVWGQCATGVHWDEKLSEMRPEDWSALWLRDRPVVLPLRAFFVPHRVPADEWEEKALRGGLLFDRCRIAALAHPLTPELRSRCRQLNRHALRAIRSRPTVWS